MRPEITRDGFWSVDGEWPCDEQGRDYKIGDEFYGPDGDLFLLDETREGVVIEVLETGIPKRGGGRGSNRSRNTRGGRGFKGTTDSDVTIKKEREPERRPQSRRGSVKQNAPAKYKEYKWELTSKPLTVPEGIVDVISIMDYMYQSGGEIVYTQTSKRAVFVTKPKETLTPEEKKKILLEDSVRNKLGADYDKLPVLRTIVGTNIEAAVKVGIADKLMEEEPPAVIEETKTSLVYTEATSVGYLFTSVEGLKRELAENVGKTLSPGLKELKETMAINYILADGIGLFQLTGQIVFIAL